jgi:hypothetical protein
MAVERVEDQRPRALEHGVDVADHEHRPDLPALAALAGDLDAEHDDLLQRLPPRLLAAGRLGNGSEDLLQAVCALHDRDNGSGTGKIPR